MNGICSLVQELYPREIIIIIIIIIITMFEVTRCVVLTLKICVSPLFLCFARSMIIDKYSVNARNDICADKWFSAHNGVLGP
jgi:hypothetical protein